MSMRETLHLCGLLLLGLLVARSWGRHLRDFYHILCDDDLYYHYYYYYPGVCNHTMDLPTDPPVPFTCVFEEAPNVTEVEVTQMALCHVHCIDQYYSGSNFNLELMHCRRGCMIQSRSSSSDCVRTCAVDECSFKYPSLVHPCGRECGRLEGECMTGCGTVFDTVMDSVNTPLGFPALINPMAPPNLTQLLAEDMHPTARYRVDISGAVSQDESARFILGRFSTLIFQVQNTSSGKFYYYWVEEDELNLEAFNHEAVNVTFAVATVAFGTSSYSPAVTLQVEAFVPDFPEQLTLDSISISFTRDYRTEFAGHLLLNISWERPDGFEHVTGYTVSLSAYGFSRGVGCGAIFSPTTYELEPTEIGLDLESSSSHRFTGGCHFFVMVQVNPLCATDLDTVAKTTFDVSEFSSLLIKELRQGVIISCPVAEFNDRFLRYDVTLAWTLEITPLVLGLIDRFVVRTERVRVSNLKWFIGYFGDIDIIHEDKSRMNYTLPLSYAPITDPNTAYNISIRFYFDEERSASFISSSSYALSCHVGTLPPEAPGVVTGFTLTETTSVESFPDGSRVVVATVTYTWTNVVLLNDSAEDTIIVDYQVWFADTPLAASAEPSGQVDSYPESAMRGISIVWFTSSLPIFTAYLQIRARAIYGRDSTSYGRVIPGDWSEPLEVVIGSSGIVTFSGLEPRRYLLRVAATNSREDRVVVRRRFEISADSSFCTVHLINDGITVGENRTTVEFTGTESFLCQLDREAAFLCTSPVELRVAEAGEHHLRISPQGCGRNRHNQVIVFNKED